MSEASHYSINSDESLKEILGICDASTLMFLKTMMPDRFSIPFSKNHARVAEVLDDDSLKKSVIVAPRGMGKTSMTTIGYVAKRILFQRSKFIVPISATSSKALLDGENLKMELLSNEYIKTIFGSLKTRAFSKEQWITSNGVMVMPRGAGQQVRGLLYGRTRPDLLLADDLETSEGVKSKEQREKTKEWFFSDVCGAIDQSSTSTRIIVVGTILHEDSLLQNLLDDPEWHSIRLELCDDQYNSNWPEFMPTERVKELVEGYRKRGQLDIFYREYRNLPISSEDAIFRQDYFKYYDDEMLKSAGGMEHVVIMDPAKTVKKHSDESAIVGVGFDSKNGRVFVRDVVHERLYPDRMLDEAFAMCARLKARTLAFEVTSLNEFITQPIKNEVVKRRLPLTLVELKARAKKEERIAALVPYYRQGYVYHNSACCGALEAQLLSFPRSALDDVMDALAYTIELFEIGGRYFEPGEDQEDEFEDLRAEDLESLPPLKEFRVI